MDVLCYYQGNALAPEVGEATIRDIAPRRHALTPSCDMRHERGEDEWPTGASRNDMAEVIKQAGASEAVFRLRSWELLIDTRAAESFPAVDALGTTRAPRPARARADDVNLHVLSNTNNADSLPATRYFRSAGSGVRNENIPAFLSLR